jgi:hypothetical protein
VEAQARSGRGLLADIAIDAVGRSVNQAVPLVVDLGENRASEIRVQLMVTVPAENLVVTPRDLDFGERTLAGVRVWFQGSALESWSARFISKQSRQRRFLELALTTMVDGSNYLIKITVDPTTPLKPGAYTGVVLIETDEGRKIEVPIKLTVVDR